MRIEHVTIPDDLAAAADELWPDSTWSELVEFALGVVVYDAQRADENTPEQQPTEVTALDDGGLEQRLTDAFSRQS